MSRGLGARQRLMLAAVAVACDRWPTNGVDPAWALQEAWDLGVGKECAERQAVQDAEYEAWKADDTRRRDEAKVRAASGDADAIAKMRVYRELDALKSALRRTREEVRGAPAIRPSRDIESVLNPSRVLAALERRGLVERWKYRNSGPTARVRITDAGRAALIPSEDSSDT